MNVLVSSLHTPTTVATSSPSKHARSPSLGRRVLAALQEFGRGRAVAELQRLARCYEGVNPQLAREFRAAAGFDALQ